MTLTAIERLNPVKARDPLDITTVHPIRKDALRAMLFKAGEDFALIDRPLDDGELARVE